MKTSTIRKPDAIRFASVLLIVTSLLAGAIGWSAMAGASATQTAATFETPATTRSFADVVEMASPSVVTVSVTKELDARPTAAFPQPERPGQGTPFDEFFERFFGGPGMGPRYETPAQAIGSGFLVEADGYIVTNNHVIDGAGEISVLLQDGRELTASLVGTDPKTDLALLKVESKEPLPALRFGDSDRARVGDWVLAIGNPFGLGGTATAGIISARGRDIRSGPYDDYLQIDAPINSGNSGGPVFNADGEVIGVNTAIFSPNGGNVGIGFAIPSTQVQTIVAELKANGSVQRGWLGVQIQDIDEELAKSLGLTGTSGALIADVVDDSPASRADLRVGDVITRFNGKEVSNAKALSLAVANADPDVKIPVMLTRDGKDMTIKVMLGDSEQLASRDVPGHASPAVTGNELGLGLTELTEGQRQRLGLPEDVEGVLVTRVDPNASAAKQGLRPGDVISRIGSKKVSTIAEARVAIEEAKSAGDHAALLVRRRDGQQFVSVAFS